MIRIRTKRGLGRPSANSRGGERSDGGRDSQLPNSVGELLGSLEPNGNGVQGMVLSSEWSEVRSRMILEGFGLLSGVPLAHVFSGEALENLEKPFRA